MSDNPKVFISYSHIDKEYEQKILSFANRLRKEGIDANVDLYEDAPSEGWQRWMESQILESDFVVIINSKSYFDKFYNNQGKGITWEVQIIYQLLFDLGGKNTKFIPVFFDENDVQYILKPLKQYTYYNIGTDDGFDDLYWRLRGIPKNIKPPLGLLRTLPERKQRTMFFSTPIDVIKWNLAEWKGMVYFFIPSKAPILGFLFKNYDAGRKIFSEWKNEANNGVVDNYISITYIVSPFPKDCWIYKEKESNNGNGYIVHVGPNIDSAFNRARSSGLEDNDILLTTVSRFRWVPELNGSENRLHFQSLTSSGKGYYIVPVSMKSWSNEPKQLTEENILLNFNDMLLMKNIEFKRGVDIDKNDPSSVALKNSNTN